MSTTTMNRPVLNPMLEHKSLFGAGQKVLDDENGIVEIIVSVTGIEDEVKDIIVPGAYTKTIANRTPKGVDAHSWENPIAKALEFVELMPGDKGLPKTTARGEPWPREAGAVKVVAQFNLEKESGRDAYSDVKFYGEEQEWSIGYNVPKGGARVDHRKGLRYIQQLDWFEFSPVLFGAMPLAGTVAVKSHGGMRMGATVETKAIPGSYEERSRALDEALTAEIAATHDEPHNNSWASVIATFEDRVVFCVYDDGVRQEYEAPYEFADGEASLGERKPVKVVESVTDDTEAVAVDELPADETETEYKDSDAAEQTKDPAADESKDADPVDEVKDPEDPETKDLDPIAAALEEELTAYISPVERIESTALRAYV